MRSLVTLIIACGGRDQLVEYLCDPSNIHLPKDPATPIAEAGLGFALDQFDDGVHTDYEGLDFLPVGQIQDSRHLFITQAQSSSPHRTKTACPTVEMLRIRCNVVPGTAEDHL